MVSMFYVHTPAAHVLTVVKPLYALMKSAALEGVTEYLTGEIDAPDEVVAQFATSITVTPTDNIEIAEVQTLKTGAVVVLTIKKDFAR